MTDISMTLVYCSQCNMPFLITSALAERLKTSHKTFYCPTGHGNVYKSRTEEDRLREQVKSQQETIRKLTAAQPKKRKPRVKP